MILLLDTILLSLSTSSLVKAISGARTSAVMTSPSWPGLPSGCSALGFMPADRHRAYLQAWQLRRDLESMVQVPLCLQTYLENNRKAKIPEN